MPDSVLIQEDSVMTGARVKRQGSWFFVSMLFFFVLFSISSSSWPNFLYRYLFAIIQLKEADRIWETLSFGR